MSFEAYDAPPFTAPDEVLGMEGITVSLSLGSLGTLRDGNIGFSRLPPTWEGRAWPRMVRVRLESEHGTGYIAAGIAEAAVTRRGEVSGVPLTGIEGVFLGQPATTDPVTGPAHPLDGGLLTPGGVAAFGIGAPAVQDGQTRLEALEAALDPHPDGEFGVTADLAGVFGVPGGVPGAAEYTLDHRAYGFRSLGYTVTDYVTDLIYQGGEGYPVRTLRRTDLPPYAPRRTERVTLDPMTETVEEARPADMAGTLGDTFPVEGLNSERTWIATLPPAYWLPSAGLRVLDHGPLRGVKLRMRYVSEIKTPHSVFFTLRMEFSDQQGTPSWQLLSLPPMAVAMSGTFTQDWELPAEMWQDNPQNRHLRRVWVVVNGDVPAGSTPETRNRFGLNAFELVATREYDRYSHLLYGEWPRPPGWGAPYVVGPTYEFSLPGVHVPPLRVHGLPGGRSQMVAGAQVTWHRGEASTKLLTGALPYPGQRRR